MKKTPLINIPGLALCFFVAASIAACTDVGEAPDPKEETDVLTVSSVQGTLPGRWQSTQDEKYILVFGADGAAQDIYDDVKKGNGTWEVLVDPDYPPMILLRRITDGELYEYSVLAVDQHQLTLSFRPRGNTLEFHRIE